MMDLFSSFNPMTSSTTSINWFILIFILMMIPLKMNTMEFSSYSLINLSINLLSNLFKSSMNLNMINSLSPIVSVFMIIFMMNLVGLIPHSFTPTAQVAINLTISMSLWMSSILFKMKSKKTLLANLVPSGTPMFLVPFMIFIEMLSILIQPMTLSIRLTANIMAGHILLMLISELPFNMFIMTIHSVLMMLEISVALIQSYVFSMLIYMYIK